MARVFLYKAMDALGRRSDGDIEAVDENEARGKLLAAGLAVLSLTEKKAAVSFNWRRYLEKRLPAADLILFTKQFRTLYMAGITLDDIFDILARQTTNKSFRGVIDDMRRRVTEGESLQQAFSSHRNVFSPLYCAMIGAGEESGALPDVLERLTYIIEHEEITKQKIASATRYPKMVVGVMAGAFLILLNVVIPQFASLYSNSKIALPWPTQVAIELNHLCQNWWWVILAAVVIAVVAWRQFVRTEKGRLWRDTLFLKIPVIGTVQQKAAIARFASILSILQRSGLSILDSLSIVADTVDNAFFRQRMAAVKDKIHSGEGVAKALTEAGGFSPLALSLITVGENTGSLEEMLTELARHYDTEVNLAVEKLTEWIGPILIICLGVVVLFFALAIFMPMWDLVKFV